MAAPNLEIQTIADFVTPTSDLDRKSALLRPLNNSLIVFGLIGLLLTLQRQSVWYNLVAIVVGLLLNMLIFYLDRRQQVRLAAYIFCLWVNVGLFFFATTNLMDQDNLNSALMFFYVLSMNVMLAGMLMGASYSFGLAVVNAAIITFELYIYYLRTDNIGQPLEALTSAVGVAIPVNIFLLMVAIISWLYQRALEQAAVRLEVARQRIMRDELLRRDLAVARELQQRLYPPPPLTNAAISIASRSEPARETSGDFYDFIQLPDDRLGIVVADVTGKSIAAALVMAMARSTLRSEATRHISPAEVLAHANRTLCQDNTFKQMITAFYGVLDTSSLRLAISNAGHPFPMLRRDGRITELEICGLPLGARDDAPYSEQVIQLLPGDQLVLISDGLLEEQNMRRELFGFERMLATVANAAADDPKRTLDDIWDTVARFRGGSEQSDDITLVVVQVAGQGFGA